MIPVVAVDFNDRIRHENERYLSSSPTLAGMRVGGRFIADDMDELRFDAAVVEHRTDGVVFEIERVAS